MKRMLITAAVATALSVPFTANAQLIGVVEADDVSFLGNLPSNMTNIVADIGGGAAWEFIPVADFNTATAAELCSEYDVLVFGWFLNSAVDADWTDLVEPYLAAGCGVVWEDPTNALAGDLTGSGLTFAVTSGSGNINIVPLAGLTDGVVSGLFSNRHFDIASFSAAWTLYQEDADTGVDVGVASSTASSGSGRMVVSGQDAMFHGVKGGGGDGQNQYQMSFNEICWTAGIDASICEVIDVDIDIKPGSFPNSINLCSMGAVPLAILGSDTFDVTEVNTSTLAFAGAGVKVVGKKSKELCSYEDVSGDFSFGPEGAPDGYVDLVCHFTTIDIAGVDGESLQATVEGELFSGQRIEGMDSVNIVKDTCN